MIENRPALSALTEALTHSPSYLMDYDNARYQDNDNGTVTVHYIVDDENGGDQHPLNDCDGNGKLISHLQGKHSEQCEAMGLNHECSPDLDLITDNEPAFRAAWIALAVDNDDFQSWANDNHSEYRNHIQQYDLRNTKNNRYYQARAEATFDGYLKRADSCLSRYDWSNEEDNGSAADIHYSFTFTEDAMLNAWKALNEAGKIGTPDRVMLDCFRHGNEIWSVKGQGPSCQWDTSSNAGVWVPDSCATDEINRRAPVYQVGYIHENNATIGSGNKRFTVMVDQPKQNSKEHSEHLTWGDAFEALGKFAAARVPDALEAQICPVANIALGRQRASEELAKDAMSMYSDWTNGSVYGIVSATLENVADDDAQWEETEEEACWGYIGSDAAESALTEYDPKESV
jgi:hypothetical protein